jgi:hypothetical protein
MQSFSVLKQMIPDFKRLIKEDEMGEAMSTFGIY